MTILDVIVLAVIALSAVLAFARGMTKELLSLIGWIVAALAVLYGLPMAQPWALKLVDHPVAANMIAGGIIFVLVLIVFAFASSRLSGWVKRSHFGGVDRSLGLVFGVLRGFVLLSLVYLLLLWAIKPTDKPKWVEEARSRPALEVGADILLMLAPKNFVVRSRAAIEDTYKRVQDAKRVREQLIGPGQRAGQPKRPGPGGGKSKPAGDRDPVARSKEPAR